MPQSGNGHTNILQISNTFIMTYDTMAFGQTWHGLPQHLLVPAMRVLQDLQ